MSNILTSTQSIAGQLPKHLRRYIVQQDYSRYTPIDQAVWRYIMRRLTNFLSVHAHPTYLDGLKKTGINIERIPNIDHMNDFLNKFGWKALPVSGFIPPSAFMELQSLGILPIASDMRTIDHILYTPAPDIVHEAAGHAPILVDPKFSSYLKKYSQVARKAIISSEDIELYEAIRVLSDLKENPNSTLEEINLAQRRLDKISSSMSHISEAGLLSRMNWWTAEYGLIGDLERPLIFGAGLLSSVGESASCLSREVKKIPLTVGCINFSYNITEPQPQLFVTPNFENLESVLEELSAQMAFRIGGVAGLEKAIAAKTVNTAEYDSGLQVSGIVSKIIKSGKSEQPDYISFSGPCALSLQGKTLVGHGRDRHPSGFGSPVGKPSNLNELKAGQNTSLHFPSGIKVTGKIISFFPNSINPLVITFADCTVVQGQELLFDPSWGEYDMAVGERIVSVFGGPADPETFDNENDFAVKVIPRRHHSQTELRLHNLYLGVREMREKKLPKLDVLKSIFNEIKSGYPNEWLLVLEMYELIIHRDQADLKDELSEYLKQISDEIPEKSEQILSGIRLAVNEKAH